MLELLCSAPLLAAATTWAPLLQEERRGDLNWRSPKIELPTELPVGTTLHYDRQWSRQRVDLGELEADALSHAALDLEVLAIDAQGSRTVRWSVGPVTWERFHRGGHRIDQAADRGVAELRTGLSYDLRLSEGMRTLLLEDLGAARLAADAAVARAEAAIRAEKFFYAETERALAIVRSTFADEALLEFSLLEEPTLLFETLGRSYRMNEDRRWQDYFLNPVGSAPLEAWAVIAPLVHDSEAGTLLVRWTKTLDLDAAREKLAGDLVGWIKRHKGTDDEFAVEDVFELSEDSRVLIELSSGLPLFAERRSVVRITSDRRVESLRLVRRGFEPPAELLADWGPPQPPEPPQESPQPPAEAGGGAGGGG
jgi:hypothetical protein